MAVSGSDRRGLRLGFARVSSAQGDVASVAPSSTVTRLRWRPCPAVEVIMTRGSERKNTPLDGFH